ncbi:MAG: hypothetical protein U9Q69_02030 [Nanoarchaeota archaeon]|nr:hypothetical protein [Nanoarchaeota archaeon]
MKINKKGAAVLLLSSLAFLIAIIIFTHTETNDRPGPNVEYIGQIEFEHFKHYSRGEEVLLFLDLSAKYSAEKVKAEYKDEFIVKFKGEFEKYLKLFNKRYSNEMDNAELKLENYTYQIIGDKLILKSKVLLPIKDFESITIDVAGKGTNSIKDKLSYKINPSVTIKINPLKTKPASIPLR